MELNISDWVPKSKSDMSHINDLKKLSDEEIKPILLPLLEWIQDINWPISYDVLQILAKHQKVVSPLVIGILDSENKDDIWKYWIIHDLLPLFSYDNLLPIIPSLKRIVLSPTRGELTEEVDMSAKKLLEWGDN